jgi:hypothetical protein
MHIRSPDTGKSARARPAPPVVLDDDVKGAIASVRNWLTELIALWPVHARDQIVLWVQSTPGDSAHSGAGARPRAQVEEQAGEVAAQVRKIRRDTPVVVELVGGRTVVIPWRALRAA